MRIVCPVSILMSPYSSGASCVRACACACAYVGMYMYVRMYVCVCVCVCVYIYIYIYISYAVVHFEDICLLFPSLD